MLCFHVCILSKLPKAFQVVKRPPFAGSVESSLFSPVESLDFRSQPRGFILICDQLSRNVCVHNVFDTALETVPYRPQILFFKFEGH